MKTYTKGNIIVEDIKVGDEWIPLEVGDVEIIASDY